VLALDGQTRQVDELVEGRVRRRPAAEVACSLPGMGVLLGAEFLAATAGDVASFGAPDRLASLAGVAPVPRDSGRVVGNVHRPQRYHRGLQRVLFTSAGPGRVLRSRGLARQAGELPAVRAGVLDRQRHEAHHVQRRVHNGASQPR
jgi:transposase